VVEGERETDVAALVGPQGRVRVGGGDDGIAEPFEVADLRAMDANDAALVPVAAADEQVVGLAVDGGDEVGGKPVLGASVPVDDVEAWRGQWQVVDRIGPGGRDEYAI